MNLGCERLCGPAYFRKKLIGAGSGDCG